MYYIFFFFFFCTVTKRFLDDKNHYRSILRYGELTYKNSGVDIEAGDSLVSAIKPASCSTIRSGTLGSIGGFGGIFDVKAAGYKDPLLVSGTDGVGTKLKVSRHYRIQDRTI